MTVAAELRHYPFEPFTGDLDDELLAMVETDPITRVILPDGRPCWLVLDYEGCCTVLADPRFSRLISGATEAPGEDAPRSLVMDGAPHACVRRIASRAFTARRMESYRPRVQRLVDGLVDDLIAGGQPGDLVSSLVAPLPMLVVCDVLGVPATDHERFYGWLEGINSVISYGLVEAVDSQQALRDYLAEQLVAKRAAPADDLLSVWLGEQATSDLTDAELVELAVGVLIGGIEINSTSTGLRALFQNPEQLAKLRANPEKLGAGAADETLRYTTVSAMFRVVVMSHDIELGGVQIRAGESVMALPWYGNRDSRFFPNPNVFDIERASKTPHLTFGFGPHFCLGAALGKMQVELSLATLLRRLPNLAPAIPLDELPWRHDRINMGIAKFPVTW